MKTTPIGKALFFLIALAIALMFAGVLRRCDDASIDALRQKAKVKHEKKVEGVLKIIEKQELDEVTQARIIKKLKREKGVLNSESKVQKKFITKLKKEVKYLKRQKPFKKLETCQNEYTILFDDYQLTLKLVDETEFALTICENEKLNLSETIKRIGFQYESCILRADSWKKNYYTCKGDWNQFAKDVKKQKLWSTVKKVVGGIVIGVFIGKVI